MRWVLGWRDLGGDVVGEDCLDGVKFGVLLPLYGLGEFWIGIAVMDGVVGRWWIFGDGWWLL